MSEIVVPDKISPEIGWRVWLVVARADGLRLHSAVQARVEWPVRRELRAECRRLPTPEALGRITAGVATPHSAPDESCGAGGGHGCGIYGTKDPSGCTEFLKGSYSPGQVLGGSVVHRVFGTVALWGKVIEAEKGWRAEFAYPVELWVPQHRYVASGSNVEGVQAPGLPVEGIASGLSDYRVPVHILTADNEALAA